MCLTDVNYLIIVPVQLRLNSRWLEMIVMCGEASSRPLLLGWLVVWLSIVEHPCYLTDDACLYSEGEFWSMELFN